MLRTATNIWIDTLRRRETEARAPMANPDGTPAPGANPAASSDLRDAGARLLQRLSPQERADFEGEPILLWFVTRRGREALEVVFRFEEEGGRIARLRAYSFCPETMRAVGEALGTRVRTGLYRAPTPAPGAYWPAPDASPRSP
jgi:hypothetical protein